MNPTSPLPPSAENVSLPPFPGQSTEPPVRLARLLLGLVLGIALFDFCFWGIESWGISLGIFFLGLAGIILANRQVSEKRRKIRLILALIVGAAFAAAIETGVANTLVLLSLTLVLAGETFFVGVESVWGRWLSQLVAMACAPGRIFWLFARFMEALFSGGLGWAGGLIGGCALAIPALVLALIFGSLLAAGNAIFGSWAESFFNWLWKELALYLNADRICLWGVVGIIILPLLRPANISPIWWKWTEQLPRWPEIIPVQAALFSSGLILVVLNLLFFIANIADALFLWSGQALPAGVTYKAYVHEGVEVLIFTVILSAIVLTATFQQALSVAGRRELKFLAYVWIIQNLFLIVSVGEKLRRYIVTYEMTVLRLSTLIFLLLVVVGFILLTIKIGQERSISWLIGGCVLATFSTFYITQYLDLAGWSANYNVAVMEHDINHRFDAPTMCKWGADVWPALRRAHELTPNDSETGVEWNRSINSRDYTQRSGLDWRYWREFSLRAWLNRWAVEEKQNQH